MFIRKTKSKKQLKKEKKLKKFDKKLHKKMIEQRKRQHEAYRELMHMITHRQGKVYEDLKFLDELAGIQNFETLFNREEDDHLPTGVFVSFGTAIAHPIVMININTYDKEMTEFIEEIFTYITKFKNPSIRDVILFRLDKRLKELDIGFKFYLEHYRIGLVCDEDEFATMAITNIDETILGEGKMRVGIMINEGGYIETVIKTISVDKINDDCDALVDMAVKAIKKAQIGLETGEI